MNTRKINKQIFLENLPKKENRNVIDWKNSIGYKVHFIYNDIEDDLEIIDYIKDEHYKLKIEYKNQFFCIRTDLFQKCILKTIFNHEDLIKYKYKIGQVIKDNKRNLIITGKKHKKTKNKLRKYYTYKCNKCGFVCNEHYNITNKHFVKELWIEESNLDTSGCACCGGIAVSKGINDIATTHPYLVQYFVNIEDSYIHSYSSGKKVLCKCPDCSFEKEMVVSKLTNRGFSCPKCGDGISYPEKFTFNVLEQLKENKQIDNFTYQYSRKNNKWCAKYRYDFYFELNNEKYIIETHGLQHYENNFNFKMPLKETRQNDKLKKELAIQNEIKEKNYIIIDCRRSELEFIKNNILHSRLGQLFNLSKVHWIECAKYAIVNLTKNVCNYWKLHNEINNEQLTTTDLSKIFEIDVTTIRKYIKRGAEMKWCSYNPKEEKRKGLSKSIKCRKIK